MIDIVSNTARKEVLGKKKIKKWNLEEKWKYSYI